MSKDFHGFLHIFLRKVASRTLCCQIIKTQTSATEISMLGASIWDVVSSTDSNDALIEEESIEIGHVPEGLDRRSRSA